MLQYTLKGHHNLFKLFCSDCFTFLDIFSIFVLLLFVFVPLCSMLVCLLLFSLWIFSMYQNVLLSSVVYVLCSGIACSMDPVFSVTFFCSYPTLLRRASLFMLMYCASVFVDDNSRWASMLSGKRLSYVCLM